MSLLLPPAPFFDFLRLPLWQHYQQQQSPSAPPSALTQLRTLRSAAIFINLCSFSPANKHHFPVRKFVPPPTSGEGAPVPGEKQPHQGVASDVTQFLASLRTAGAGRIAPFSVYADLSHDDLNNNNNHSNGEEKEAARHRVREACYCFAQAGASIVDADGCPDETMQVDAQVATGASANCGALSTSIHLARQTAGGGGNSIFSGGAGTATPDVLCFFLGDQPRRSAALLQDLKTKGQRTAVIVSPDLAQAAETFVTVAVTAALAALAVAPGGARNSGKTAAAAVVEALADFPRDWSEERRENVAAMLHATWVGRWPRGHQDLLAANARETELTLTTASILAEINGSTAHAKYGLSAQQIVTAVAAAATVPNQHLSHLLDAPTTAGADLKPPAPAYNNAHAAMANAQVAAAGALMRGPNHVIVGTNPSVQLQQQQQQQYYVPSGAGAGTGAASSLAASLGVTVGAAKPAAAPTYVLQTPPGTGGPTTLVQTAPSGANSSAIPVTLATHAQPQYLMPQQAYGGDLHAYFAQLQQAAVGAPTAGALAHHHQYMTMAPQPQQRVVSPAAPAPSSVAVGPASGVVAGTATSAPVTTGAGAAASTTGGVAGATASKETSVSASMTYPQKVAVNDLLRCARESSQLDGAFVGQDAHPGRALCKFVMERFKTSNNKHNVLFWTAVQLAVADKKVVFGGPKGMEWLQLPQ